MKYTHRIIATAVAATAVAAGLGAGAVSAQEDDAPPTTPTTTTERSARAEQVCLRLPDVQSRVTGLLERIEGDADTRGSLLWLDDRIAAAESRDRLEVVEMLTNRRVARESAITVLETGLNRLAELQAQCDQATPDT